VEFMLNESLGEDVESLFRGRVVLQADDPTMNQLSDVMHVDLDVFCSLSLHWVFEKFQCALIVTPDGIQSVELDTKLGEEVL